jgi:hypothetical protein
LLRRTRKQLLTYLVESLGEQLQQCGRDKAGLRNQVRLERDRANTAQAEMRSLRAAYRAKVQRLEQQAEQRAETSASWGKKQLPPAAEDVAGP